jgi:tetratricopeptide (TPR) repeat protein/CHAT domain-containing protein
MRRLRFGAAILALLLQVAAGPTNAEEQGYIGTNLQEVSQELASQQGLDSARGAFVHSVRRNSPAERHGLKAGDIIVAVDGIVIANRGAFITAIQARKPGILTELDVIREHQRQKVALIVGRLPQSIKLYAQLDALEKEKRFADAILIANQVVDLAKVESGELSSEVGDALSRLYWLHRYAQQVDNAETVLLQLVAQRQASDGPEGLELANALIELGSFYTFLRPKRSEAETHLRRALAIQSSKDAPKHRLIVTYRRFGDLLWSVERYEESETQYRLAVALYEEMGQAQHADVAELHTEIGNTLRWRKLYDQAEASYRKALEIRETVLGSDHPEIVKWLYALGGNFLERQQFAEAAALYHRALEIRRAALGEDHVDVGWAHHTLGNALRKLGKHEEALEHYRRLTIIWEKAKGPEHDDFGWALGLVAETLKELGRFEEAESSARRSLTVRQQALGADHVNVGWAHSSLGNVLGRLGRHAEALEHYRQMAAIFERTKGPEHEDFGFALSQVGDRLQHLYKYVEAESVLKRSLEVRERTLGPNHASVGWTLSRLADVMQSLGRWSDAESFARRGLAVRQAALGADHVDVGWQLNTLGNVLDRLGRQDEALEHYRQMAAIFERTKGPEHEDFGFALSQVGDQLRRLNRPAEAESVLKRALEVRERALGPNHASVGWTLSRLADVMQSLERLSDAETFARRGLAVRQAALGPNHVDVGWAHSALGDVLYQMARYEESLRTYQRALQIMEDAQLLENAGNILGNIGRSLFQLSRLPEAEVALRRALQLREEMLGADHGDLGWTLTQLSGVLRQQLKFQEAENYARRSLEIRQNHFGKDSDEVAQAYAELADCVSGQGRFEESIAYLERALIIGEKTWGSDHFYFGNYLQRYALVFFALGDYAKAEPIARRALFIFESSRGINHPLTTLPLGFLAYLVDVQGRFAESEPMHRRALAILESSLPQSSLLTANTLNGLVSNLYQQSKYEEAESLNQRAISIKLQHFPPNNLNLAHNHMMMAEILRATGRLSDAELSARTTVTIYENGLGSDHPWFANALSSLARIVEALGRSDEAEPLYRRALEIQKDALGPSNPGVAWHHSRLGELAERRNAWTQALEHYRTAASIVSSRSIETTRRHLTVDNEVDRTRYVFWQLIDAAYGLSVKESDLDEALMSESFRAAQWGARTETEEALAQMGARVASGAGELAALIREQQDLRARWKEFERRTIGIAGSAEGRIEGPQAADLRREFLTLERRIDEITAEIGRRNPSYADLVNPQPLSIDEVQRLLKFDEAMVFYSVTNLDTYMWVVTRESADWRRVYVNRRALNDRVARLRCGLDESGWRRGTTCRDLLQTNYTKFDSILSTPLPFDLRESHSLYNDFLWPLDHLFEGKKLLIVPSGPLTQLPFHALVTDTPDETLRGHAAYGAAAWLASKHSIAILPSVSSLRALRQHAQASLAQRPYIGFGNPLLQGNPALERQAAAAADARRRQSCAAIQLADLGIVRRTSGGQALKLGKDGLVDREALLGMVALPDTADELCAVAQHARASDHDIYLGERNRESTFKALSTSGRLADYRIIHLATHGLVVGEQGAGEPGLVFTPPANPDLEGPDGDGYLSASEVAELKLDADWVILSACNTASSGARDNQALSGLARAFLYAGARSVLVSHWPVVSSTTAELITETVGSAMSKEFDRATALQQAMLSMIAQGGSKAHPEHWAPFVLVGEPAPVGSSQ